MVMAEAMFWLCLLSIAYAYAGFPILVALAGQLANRRVQRAPVTPSLSLVIAAYNEEEQIERRLENALRAVYPKGLLEILVASDGSTDSTESIVERFAGRGVRLIRLPRMGKISALDAAVREATGEVLVFSDANINVEPGALWAMAENFADGAVGGVAGHTAYRQEEGAESSSRGEGMYWRYDTWLKEMESRTGSVVSAHGGLYAIRRELYQRPPEAAVTDDFAISTAVVAQGRRLVFEPGARAWEVALPVAGSEFRRRVRLMTRGLRAVALRPRLLNPLHHGFYSVVLFSHKVLRRLVAPMLPILFVASLLLVPEGGLYAAAAGAQVALYALASLGYLLRKQPSGQWKIFFVPFFYCLANAAAIVALLRFMRGDRIELWQPQRHEARA